MDKNIDPIEETKKIILANLPADKALGSIDEITKFLKSKRINWAADTATKRLSIAFLDEAERDVKSCRTLHSKKIYSHSVYHLQQAVEKSMKGYCLGLGILSIQEIRSHDTPYVLLKGLFEKTGMKSILESSDKDTKDRFDKAWDAIENPEKRLEIARLPFQQIMDNLRDIDNYQSISKRIGILLSQLAVQVKGKSEPLPPEISTLSIMASLYILGTASFPHEEFTRYPDRQMTPVDYVCDLGIVKAVTKMTDYLTRSIKELRDQLTQLP
ncbi:MAG: HEPN domain-containing protein [Dehalococcoidales bacterium]|nr:HEPN domain-containing protein [Dehalococcoidales bacterium]